MIFSDSSPHPHRAVEVLEGGSEIAPQSPGATATLRGQHAKAPVSSNAGEVLDRGARAAQPEPDAGAIVMETVIARGDSDGTIKHSRRGGVMAELYLDIGRILETPAATGITGERFSIVG